MKFVLDMVHHNPGEAPFSSAFNDPAHLLTYGYNGQVFKHLNCVATFAACGVDVFPAGSPERVWLDDFTLQLERQMSAAKAKGLSVFHHVDLFVLPKRLVEHFRAEICDPKTGRISLDRPQTLALHKILFDELCARFPLVDGFIVRIGETYLYDAPYHIGNGPITHASSDWMPEYAYEQLLAGRPAEPDWSAAHSDAYVKLIRFLRSELCVRHDKFLIFRTWDIFPDRLHARLDHYLEVTDQIEPHEKLLFSIKHTALDFWRRVKVNECLTRGKHPQLIEVQCQREYEGKGAYPNYIMEGVIDGFEENARKIGLKDLVAHPRIQGIYGWSRGGGWYGPNLQSELWPDLNAYVLGQFARHPALSEEIIFSQYARERLCLSSGDCKRFRQLCQLSAKAILKGRYCEAFDRALGESLLPTGCWMRDDRLGGRTQLNLVLTYLYEKNLLSEALREKAEAVALWENIRELAGAIAWPGDQLGSAAMVSAQYGELLFRIVHAGWRVLAAGYVCEHNGHCDVAEIAEAAADYHACWRKYRELASSPFCASLYHGCYFNLPGASEVAGLDESVAHYERLARAPRPQDSPPPSAVKTPDVPVAVQSGGAIGRLRGTTA